VFGGGRVTGRAGAAARIGLCVSSDSDKQNGDEKMDGTVAPEAQESLLQHHVSPETSIEHRKGDPAGTGIRAADFRGRQSASVPEHALTGATDRLLFQLRPRTFTAPEHRTAPCTDIMDDLIERRTSPRIAVPSLVQASRLIRALVGSVRPRVAGIDVLTVM